MPGGTDLDQATLIVDPELAAVDVAEVDLHSYQFAAELPQKSIHLTSDKLVHSRIHRYVFVAVDLNPHTFLCSPPSRAVKDFLRSDSQLEAMIPFGG
jgi:hypothetical protein